MKKTAFAAKSLMALLAVGAISCSGTDNKSAVATTPDTVNQDGAVSAIATNIRFIDLDSVLSAYTLAQELAAEGNKLMVDYQKLERQKGVELQNAGASIEQKRNNGIYLSQESFNKDVEELNRKQAEAQNILAAQQNKVSRQLAEHQQRINDSIKSFVDSYVATHKYDAILYREAGVYFNPALDVTADFISGLNNRYTPAEKK